VRGCVLLPRIRNTTIERKDMKKKSEFEKLVIYTDILESLIADAFLEGSFQERFNDGKSSKEYAKERIEFIRRSIAVEMIVRFNDLVEDSNNSEEQQ